MKNIKENEQLIKMSLALGIEPDPKIVKEVLEYKQMMADVKKKSSEIASVFEQISKLKDEIAVLEKIKVPSVSLQIPKPPSLDDIQFLFEQEKPTTVEVPKPPTVEELLEQFAVKDEIVEEVKAEVKSPNKLVDLAATHITKEVMKEQKAATTFQEPDVPVAQTITELKRKVKLLEDWLSKIALTGPGSGEVNLLRLDDVDTSQLADEKYLRYNAANAKIEFATVSGGGGGAVDLGNVSSNIVPTANSVFNLGAPDKRFKTLFLANNTIDLGGSLISSDGTGQISISGTGAVLPTGSKIDFGARQEKIALVGDSGTVINTVPFFTQALGLNTIATTFQFGANPDDYVFTNFTLNNGTGLQQSGVAQFYF